jgi:MraZ protein
MNVKVDAKGRGIITCASKEANDAFSSRRFCLEAFCFQPCLELYPMDQWNLMMQKINKLNRFVKENNDFIRRFTAGVKVVEIDSLGRILVKDLVAFSNITKRLVFIGGKYCGNMG